MSALIGSRNYKGSFPKDKIIIILSELVSQSKIVQFLVNLILDEYDDICKHLSSLSNPYNDFKNEYMNLI